MYQGKGHIWQNKFNKVSDFMDRYYQSPEDAGKPRPSVHYRSELRNAARIAYRVAKKTIKAQRKNNES
jgi:hypothetical protein